MANSVSLRFRATARGDEHVCLKPSAARQRRGVIASWRRRLIVGYVRYQRRRALRALKLWDGER